MKFGNFLNGPNNQRLEDKIFSAATFTLMLLAVIFAGGVYWYEKSLINFTFLMVFALIYLVLFFKRRHKNATLGGTTFFSIVSLSFVNFIWIWAFSIDSSANEIFILVLLIALSLLPVRWHLIATCAFLLNVFLLSWVAYVDTEPPGRTSFVTQQLILGLLMCGIALIIYRLRLAYEWEQGVSAKNYRKVVQVNESLNNRNAHLESLARMVSHNLRSPISGMKML